MGKAINDIQGFKNPAQLAEAARAYITQLIPLTIENTGRFNIALSGGSTPRLLYERLAAPESKNVIDWSKVFFFWGDERMVPWEAPESNFNTAWRALISKIKIPRDNIVAPNVDLATATQCAEDYEDQIRRHFSVDMNKIPSFDLILLGMGPDGHTASLFPGRPELKETRRLVVGMDEPVGEPPLPRISFTLPLINGSRVALILISGAGKAEVIKKIWSDTDKAATHYPVAMVRPALKRLWYHDIQF